MAEQRKSRRFDLRLPVEVIRAGTRPMNAACFTKNLSSCGVLMSTDAKLTIGESIEFVITLPPSIPGSQSVRVRCLGKVVRHEHAASASTLERYEFLRD